VLIKILTIYYKVVKVVVDEFKFYIVEDHVQQAGKHLGTRGNSERNAAILVQIPISAKRSQMLRSPRKGIW
jgi:hypothetical protein